MELFFSFFAYWYSDSFFICGCRWCFMVLSSVVYHQFCLSLLFWVINLHFSLQKMRYYVTSMMNNLCNQDVPWHFMNFLFILQKQNVEKAKATLLNENLDGSTSVTDNKQSDHLLLVIAYDKWSRILLQVINYFFFCNNTPFLLFGSFWCVCTILLYTNFFLYMICVVGRSYYETAAGRISNKMVFEFQNGAKSARQFCHSFYLNNTVMHMIRFISSEVKSVYIYIYIVGVCV